MLKTVVDYWDTAYPVLEGDVASAGIPMWIREPLGDGTFTLRQQLEAAANDTDVTTVFDNATYSKAILVDESGDPKEGRVSTLINYWAGGAPGVHGASTEGNIAYHFKCVLRPVNGRSWWSSTAIPTWRMVFGGNGFFRIDKVVSGNTTTLFKGPFTEKMFLDGEGLEVLEPIDDMGPGDYLDIYYVQDSSFDWGGYVFKAMLAYNQINTTTKEDSVRAAPVIGCDLFDNGTQPTKVTLHSIGDITINKQPGSVVSGAMDLPLANTQLFDAIGWEWIKPTDASPGYVKMYNGNLTTTNDIHRARLLRIKSGWTDASGDELYTMHTGFIDDFGNITNTGVIPVEFTGFEQRLMDQHVKNFPDRISYMAVNYKKRRGTSQPVYDTPAYDAWPLELVLRDLFVRAGLPESLTRQVLTVGLSNGTAQQVVFNDEVFLKFRARAMSGRQIRLDRPVHYGNNGQGYDAKKPADDEYLFKQDNTQEIWSIVRDLSERYGYNVWFDEFGHCVVRTANNPSSVYDLIEADSSTQKTNPNAYAGTYQEWTGTPSLTYTFTASRIDVIMPRFVSAGHWSFTVTKAGVGVVSSGTIDPSLPSGSGDEFFYDFRTTIDGANTTVATLYSGEYATYTVALTASGGAATRRIDAFLLWHADPLMPRFDHLFSTTENALDVAAQGTMTEMRNYVIVVGRRNAIITDSTKLETNPNNPSYEFVVKSAVDVDSILDPAAPNFIGYQKESVIYDDRITDDEYAGYVANSFIFKYRNPKPSAKIEHTLVPVIQLFEPVYAIEQKFGTIIADAALWITGITHKLSYGSSTTTMDTTSYIPLPSYEPREDIDIDANFGGNPVVNVAISYRTLEDQDVANIPLGSAIDTDETTDIVGYTIPVVGNALDMTGKPWPPIPGTVSLVPDGSALGDLAGTIYTPGGSGLTGFITGGNADEGKVLFNSSITTPRLDGVVALSSVSLQISSGTFSFAPNKTIVLSTTRPTVSTFDSLGQWYYEFNKLKGTVTAYRVNGPLPSAGASDPYRFTLVINWYKEQGNTHPDKHIANNPYHHFFNVDYRDSSRTIDLIWNQGDNSSDYARNTGVTNYGVRYRKLWPGALTSDPGDSPFYDPYASELGHLVNIQADFLLSGLYRISVRSTYDDTVVAWLTESGADPEDENAHWQFFTAGGSRVLKWDGVDNVGIWNKQQSHLWAVLAQGAFEKDGLPVVGKGFYVWNREEDGNGVLGKLALISGLRDPDTEAPIFGHGTYACWYVKYEVVNDNLGEVARIVNTKTLDSDFNDGDESAVIYTHLSEPTRVEITEIADFSTTQQYDKGNPPTTDAGYWQTTPTVDAIIHNKKPVRVRYSIVPRPGPLWAGNEEKASIRLFELAHMRVHIFDQFMVFDGNTYPGSDVPKRTLANRRLTNDEHSVVFTSDDWITGETFKQSTGDTGREWVFLPEDFKQDFGNSVEESVEFGNYLQIEEVPFWDESRQISGKHSRMQIAFMNYLFYLSTYTQDRSGRFSWAQNRKWLDRSKIIKNVYADWTDPTNPDTPSTSVTYRTPWQDDLHYQHRRSVIVRQWQDEPDWRANERTKWGFSSGDIGDQLLRHKWKDHDPAATTINGVAWSSFSLNQDNYSRWHTDGGRIHLPSQFGSLMRQLGNATGGGGTKLVNWTWEGNPIWVPCISRDFHPYFLLPPMPDMPGIGSIRYGIASIVDGDFNKKFWYLTVDKREYDSDTNQGNDVAAAEVWNSCVFDMTETYDASTNTPHVKFWPGSIVATTASPAAGWMSPGQDRGNQSNMFDYLRQDEITHYEDIRGMFSRGPRPAEPSRKVTPGGPYYINPYSYTGITVEENVRRKDDTVVAGSPGYPKYRAGQFVYTNPSGFFHMKFRHQYYWESGNMFPTNDKGVEALYAMNYTKSRATDTTKLAVVKNDNGAWTGWKDDVVAGSLFDPAYRVYQSKIDGSNRNVFETGFMPIAVGPRLIQPDGTPTTIDMIFSMTLVDERREGPIG